MLADSPTLIRRSLPVCFSDSDFHMLSIRKAIPEDLPTLADIFLSSRQQAFHWIDPSTFLLEDFTPQTEGEIIYVAHEEDNVPIGFISLWEPDRFVHHLFIAEPHRGKGIGKALLDQLPAWLPGPSPYSLKCLMDNKPAMQFYHHLGWRELSRGMDSFGQYALLEFFPTEVTKPPLQDNS